MLPRGSAYALSWANTRNALNLQKFYAIGGRRPRGTRWRGMQNPHVPLRHGQRVYCFTGTAFENFQPKYRQNSHLEHWSVFWPEGLPAVPLDDDACIVEELFLRYLPHPGHAIRLRVTGKSFLTPQRRFVHLLNLVNDVPGSYWQTIALLHSLGELPVWGRVGYSHGEAVGAVGAFRAGHTVGIDNGLTVPKRRGRGTEFADGIVRIVQNQGFRVTGQSKPELKGCYARVSARWERWDS